MAGVSGTQYTWAPEWFANDDGSLHVLVSASPWATNEHVIYEIHPLDPDNLAGNWSDPMRLTGSAFPIFAPAIDSSQRVGAYDPYVLKLNGVYHLWYFNRPTSSLAHATAPTLLGPYTADATVNLYGTGSWKEGETMTHLGGTTWRFTYANAITSTLYYIESTNDWATWSAPTALGSPEGIIFNHGTVMYNPAAPRFTMEVAPTTEGDLQLTFPSLKQNGYQFEWSTNLIDWFEDSDPFEGDGLPVDILRPIVTFQHS